MYRQMLAPVGGSLALSSIFAAAPLLVLFLLLGVVRMSAWVASVIGLAVSLAVALLVYRMPVDQSFLSASEGAAFGFFPILWIVINAIWIYNMTVESGHFDVLRRSFSRVSDDQRVQAIIIAFCFGALLEALAGFGAPVAISAVMLIVLGFAPMRAAAVSLVANTAPVAFGALAVPITTLEKVSQLPVRELGAMTGRQTPVLALFVPLALVFIVDGRRGVRQTWLPAVVAGVTFAVGQWVTSNYLSVQLTDIIAAFLSGLGVVGLLRVWRPSETPSEKTSQDPEADSAEGDVQTPAEEVHDYVSSGQVADPDSFSEVWRAYAPYVLIVVILILSQWKPVATVLNYPTKTFNWPGLNVQTAAGRPSTLTQFKLDWLASTGTMLLFAGVLSMPLVRVSPPLALRTYWATLRQLKEAIITVLAVLALAFVMNLSGQTSTLGNWMAGARGAFAVISPLIGWLGVAVTGSDTSSNALFGDLQVQAAARANLSPLLMAASNSSGGVLGKMISPQNLAIATSAVGVAGQEGDLFRRVLPWTLVFLAAMCLLVFLQATPILRWMVP